MTSEKESCDILVNTYVNGGLAGATDYKVQDGTHKNIIRVWDRHQRDKRPLVEVFGKFRQGDLKQIIEEIASRAAHNG